ncbi:MAG: hypothetical protein SVR08_10175 [Spirochaetota bacterium]|nr:hypothetical protein [Spirochaetota bacterium]
MSNEQATIEQKFDPGRILSSKAILMRIEEDCDFKTFVDNSIERHLCGDWGNISDQDKKKNNNALELNNLQIISCYKNMNDKIYIITEWDRSSTLVLFGFEY